MRAFLLLILAFFRPAFAVDFSGEVGQCKFSLERNGALYQKERHTDNYMTPRCYTLGLADRFKDGPWGWRIGFVTTGAVEGRDNIAAVVFEGAPPSLQCNPATGLGCVGKFDSWMREWGLSFGATYEKRIGPFRITGESGLFFFHTHAHAAVTQIDCTSCGQFGEYDQTSGPFMQPTPLVGLTLRYEHVYFAARHYWPADHRPLSNTNYAFTQLSGGLVWEFK
jgi:hypothetical protein